MPLQLRLLLPLLFARTPTNLGCPRSPSFGDLGYHPSQPVICLCRCLSGGNMGLQAHEITNHDGGGFSRGPLPGAPFVSRTLRDGWDTTKASPYLPLLLLSTPYSLFPTPCLKNISENVEISLQGISPFYAILKTIRKKTRPESMDSGRSVFPLTRDQTTRKEKPHADKDRHNPHPVPRTRSPVSRTVPQPAHKDSAQPLCNPS